MESASLLLLYASCEEENACALRYHLDALGARYQEIVIDKIAGDDVFTVCPRSIDRIAEEVKVVWCRKPTLVDVSGTTEAITRHKNQELAKVATNLAALLRDCHWVNDFFAESAASNKLFQLVTAAQLGLKVPRWICTNSRARVEAFAAEVEGRIVAKCLYYGYFQGGSWIPTTEVHLDSLPSVHLGIPMIFQEYVEKEYELRITVIGEHLFSCRIDSQKAVKKETRIDWRHYDLPNTPHTEVELPEELESLIMELMRGLGLVMGCIDFIVTPAREYVFLEVNSSGQWGWIECLTGMPITRTLAEYLRSKSE